MKILVLAVTLGLSLFLQMECDYRQWVTYNAVYFRIWWRKRWRLCGSV